MDFHSVFELILTIILGITYRYPTNSFNDFQCKFLKTLNKLRHEKLEFVNLRRL